MITRERIYNVLEKRKRFGNIHVNRSVVAVCFASFLLTWPAVSAVATSVHLHKFVDCLTLFQNGVHNCELNSSVLVTATALPGVEAM